MKGFKRWWKAEGFYFEYEGMCEDTWRAALGFVNDMFNANKLHGPHVNVSEVIKEELEK